MLARRPLLVLALIAALGASLLVGCGSGSSRTSMAIASARREGGRVVVTTECADRLAVEVRPDPRGSGLVQVSLWGRPRIGRCVAMATVQGVPADQAKLVDAATGQVVDIEG